MTDKERTVEETDSGWTMRVRAQTMYQNASGQFVSRSDYVEERNAEIRDDDDDDDDVVTDGGFGIGGFGEGGFGH